MWTIFELVRRNNFQRMLSEKHRLWVIWSSKWSHNTCFNKREAIGVSLDQKDPRVCLASFMACGVLNVPAFSEQFSERRGREFFPFKQVNKTSETQLMLISKTTYLIHCIPSSCLRPKRFFSFKKASFCFKISSTITSHFPVSCPRLGGVRLFGSGSESQFFLSKSCFDTVAAGFTGCAGINED